MQQMHPRSTKKQLSQGGRAGMLIVPVLWAIIEFKKTVTDNDAAYALGAAIAPMLWSLVGVSIVWWGAKLFKKPLQRPFLDYFIVWALVLTILGILASLMAAGKTATY